MTNFYSVVTWCQQFAMESRGEKNFYRTKRFSITFNLLQGEKISHIHIQLSERRNSKMHGLLDKEGIGDEWLRTFISRSYRKTLRFKRPTASAKQFAWLPSSPNRSMSSHRNNKSASHATGAESGTRKSTNDIKRKLQVQRFGVSVWNWGTTVRQKRIQINPTGKLQRNKIQSHRWTPVA